MYDLMLKVGSLVELVAALEKRVKSLETQLGIRHDEAGPLDHIEDESDVVDDIPAGD